MTNKEIAWLYHFTASTDKQIAYLSGITTVMVRNIAHSISAHSLMEEKKKVT